MSFDIDFESTEREFRKLRRKFQDGRIDEDTFRKEIKKLQVRDEQGRYWTIGVQTGEWYYYDGARWVQEDPPEPDEEPVSQPRASEALGVFKVVPGWLWTGCGGFVALAVAATLIIFAVGLWNSKDVITIGGTTPTLEEGPAKFTPTPGPTTTETPTPTPSPTEFPMQDFGSSSLGFSLRYPQGWYVREDDRMAVFAPEEAGLDALSFNAPFFAVILPLSGKPETGLLADLISTLPTSPGSVNQDVVTIGGAEWSVSQAHFQTPNMGEAIGYLAAVNHDGVGYTLLIVAPSAEWGHHSTMFQLMINSFRFSTSAVAAAATPSGEVATPTPLAEAVTPTPTPEPKTYVVQTGDTLLGIAYEFGVDPDLLQSVNGIDRPESLQAGQELIIPVSGQEVTAEGTGTPTAPKPTTAATATPSGEAADVTPSAETPGAGQTPAATPQPTSQPPGELTGKIAYSAYDTNTRQYNVWISDVNGTNPQLIAVNASQPALSSDGILLAYHSWEESQQGIAFMDLKGGRQGLLTHFPEDFLPVWDPGGSTITFSTRREGDRVPRPYRVGQMGGDDNPLPGTQGSFTSAEFISVFPNGNLVFRGCVQVDCGIFTTNALAGSPQRVVVEGRDTGVAVSPGGDRIAYMSDRDGNWEVYVMNADGSGSTRLTNDPAADALPAWSPDGLSIAFASTRGGAWSIWVMNADGSNQRQLFSLPGSLDGVVEHDAANSHGWLEERISWAP